MNDNDDEYLNFILTRSEETNAKNKCTFFAFISLFRGSNIWNSYIHHYFIFIFAGYTTRQFHDQLPARANATPVS